MASHTTNNEKTTKAPFVSHDDDVLSNAAGGSAKLPNDDDPPTTKNDHHHLAAFSTSVDRLLDLDRLLLENERSQAWLRKKFEAERKLQAELTQKKGLGWMLLDLVNRGVEDHGTGVGLEIFQAARTILRAHDKQAAAAKRGSSEASSSSKANGTKSNDAAERPAKRAKVPEETVVV